MIRVSRLNGKEFILNSEMIKSMESTPDTVITLSSGEKLMVKESIDQILQAVMEYKRKIFQQLPETFMKPEANKGKEQE